MNGEYMKKAAQEAAAGVERGDGGPFGALIVRDGEVVSLAHNTVLATGDPTAHAEINAIREASKKLGRFNLHDCELYTSCQPCPMCLAAVYWAKIPRIYYGCTVEDAAEAGFDDRYIYEAICGSADEKRLEAVNAGREDCLPPFELWKEKKDRTRY